MISNKCQYALRAILYLSVEADEKHKKSIRDIAGALNMPGPYLGKILQEIVAKQIISSAKGPNGGFYLTPKNLRTSLIEVIEAVDGLSYFTSCGLGLSECSEDHPCPIHDDFKIVRDHIQHVFSSKTIQELAKEIKANDLFLVR